MFTGRELDVLSELVPTLSLCEGSVMAVAPRAFSALANAACLTRREREVIAHLHLGHTNAQIALALLGAEPLLPLFGW